MNNPEVENRIREVRRALGLRQSDFAQKLGVSTGVISNIELHRNLSNISDNPICDLICRMFNVNKQWLFNGNGDMFLPRDNSYVTELQKAYNLSPEATLIIQRFIDMNDEERDEFLKAAKILMKE